MLLEGLNCISSTNVPDKSNSIDLGNVWRKMYSWRSTVLKLISSVDKIKVMFLSQKRERERHYFGFWVTYNAWGRKTSHCGIVVFKKENLIYYLSQEVNHGVSVQWGSLAIYVPANLSFRVYEGHLSNRLTLHFGKFYFILLSMCDMETSIFILPEIDLYTY